VQHQGNSVFARPIHFKDFELGMKGGICYWEIGIHLNCDSGNPVKAAEAHFLRPLRDFFILPKTVLHSTDETRIYHFINKIFDLL